jgi:hypothetical protein
VYETQRDGIIYIHSSHLHTPSALQPFSSSAIANVSIVFLLYGPDGLHCVYNNAGMAREGMREGYEPLAALPHIDRHTTNIADSVERIRRGVHRVRHYERYLRGEGCATSTEKESNDIMNEIDRCSHHSPECLATYIQNKRCWLVEYHLTCLDNHDIDTVVCLLLGTDPPAIRDGGLGGAVDVGWQDSLIPLDGWQDSLIPLDGWQDSLIPLDGWQDLCWELTEPSEPNPLLV